MTKISKITIVHTVSRKFEEALDKCQQTCQDFSVEVLDVLSIADFNLAKEIDKHAKKENRKIDCLIQLKISKEESKFGLQINDFKNLLSSYAFSAPVNLFFAAERKIS